MLTRELPPAFPTVLAAGTAPSEEGELSDPAVDVTRVPLVRPVRPATDLRALGTIRRLLAEHRIDVVHTHMAKAGAVGRLAAATTRPRPRTVHTFHGHVLDGYFSPAVERAFVTAERQLARRTDVLIAVSAEIRDQLLELRIGRPDQYRVVPLGLELDELLETPRGGGAFRAELGLDESQPLLGIVGRLAPIKDHRTMFEALALLDRAHLAVVGGGELEADLRSHVDELGLGERVHFTGWRHDLANIFRDIDVAVLTSRNEGTPVALIEAHATGVPAVATDVGGVRTVVQDGRTGVVVPPADPRALAHALRDLIEDRGRRQEFGAAAREHVRERFGHERLVRDIRELYTSLLS